MAIDPKWGDKKRFNKLAKKHLPANGGDVTNPDINTIHAYETLYAYSQHDLNLIKDQQSQLKSILAEAEGLLDERQRTKVEYTKSFKVYNDLIVAPYWGMISEEEAEAYAVANSEFADANEVEEYFSGEDRDSQFRAALDAYLKGSIEKAQADLVQKALELVEAQTWTGATTDADIQTWHESAAIRDAYLKTAFSFLTDAQLLELKTDSEAAKATLGQRPVQEFDKLTKRLKSEAEAIGAGGAIAETVSEWSDAKAKADQIDWETIKTEEAKEREKATTEATLSADAYLKVGVGTQFLVEPIIETITILESRIATEKDELENLEAHKDTIEQEKVDYAQLNDKLRIPEIAKNNLLDFPSARQTHQATLNSSFERIKKKILTAVERGDMFVNVHHLFEHEFDVLIDRGYQIVQYKDGSPDKKAAEEEASGVDKDREFNYQIRWQNLDIATDMPINQSWFTTIGRGGDFYDGDFEDPKAS